MMDTADASAKKALEILSRNLFFKGLEPFYLRDFVSKAEMRSYPPRAQIISEGDSGDSVYFILSGKAVVALYGEDGKEIVVAALKEGDIFGEMSIVDELPRSANVEASTQLECMVLAKPAFLDYLSRHHKVYMRLFAYLTGRLREATRKIGGLALLDVCGRIAQTLMGLSKTGASAMDGGDKVIAIDRPTHEELAAMIGSSREVVSRALKKMSRDGYIKIEKKRILLYK